MVTHLDLPQLIQQWNAQSPEAVAARATQIMPFWVSLALVIAVGYYAARLLWLLAPASDPADWTPPAFSGVPTNSAGPAADATAYAGIATAHLFGQATAAADPALTNPEQAPETQLNLQLRGAVAAINEGFAHAIIADSSGIEKVYFLKDTVPGGAIMQQVLSDRVILNRGGTLEALMLPRLSEGGGTGGSIAAPRPAIQPLARRQSPSMQDVVTQNAGGIGEIIRPQPFMPNGELRGYRLYPGRNREQFVALGLQPGDLVTEINGMTLNNPTQAMELFRSLANTTSVTVVIERLGQAQTLTLDTTQVAATAGGGTGSGPVPAPAPPGGAPPGGTTQ